MVDNISMSLAFDNFSLSNFLMKDSSRSDNILYVHTTFYLNLSDLLA